MFTTILRQLRLLRRDERGAAAIEYGLIAAGIALAAAVSIPSIKQSISSIYSSISTQLSTAAGSGSAGGSGG